MFPLGLMAPGETAEVMALKFGRTHNSAGQARMEDMGIRPGKKVRMLTNEGGGPVLLKVDEARIALGRGMAMKVMVKKIS